MPRLRKSLITSVIQTAVVEKYRTVPVVLVYRKAIVYVAATKVITVKQYNLKSKLTFSGKQKQNSEIYMRDKVTTLTSEPQQCNNILAILLALGDVKLLKLWNSPFHNHTRTQKHLW